MNSDFSGLIENLGINQIDRQKTAKENSTYFCAFLNISLCKKEKSHQGEKSCFSE